MPIPEINIEELNQQLLLSLLKKFKSGSIQVFQGTLGTIDIDNLFRDCVKENEITKDQIKILELLIEKGANVNAVDQDEMVPLHYAQNREVAELLINKGADVNAVDDWGKLPLHYVQDSGITKLLIDAGANADAMDDLERTPLHYAENKEVAELLINNGANVNAVDCEEKTPLHYAENKETAELLINNGANVNAEDGLKRAPLHYAKNQKVAKLLIDKGADINAIDVRQSIPLHDAKNEEVVKLLINKGADINARDATQSTPLHYAENEKVAELLINKGANVNAVNSLGKAPLHTVKNKELAELLILKRADIDHADDYGRTILHNTQDEEIVKLLIYHKASIDAKDKQDNTPLHFCRDDKVAKLLIEADADVNAKNKYHETPLHSTANPIIVEMLIAKGADVNAKDTLGATPLHYLPKIEIAKLLIAKGVDINAQDNEKRTALYISCELGNRSEKIRNHLLSLKDKDENLLADVELLPDGVSTLMEFFQDGGSDHKRMRNLLRQAGCAEVNPFSELNLEKQTKKFMYSAQNTHDTLATQAVDETVHNMREIVGGFDENYLKKKEDGLVANKEAQEEFISKHLDKFYDNLGKAYNSYSEENKKRLKAGYKRINGYKDENTFTSLANGANNQELHSLISAVIDKKCATEEEKLDAYKSILEEAQAKVEVCAQGFFNGVSQALVGINGVVISAEELLKSSFDKDKEIEKITKGVIGFENVTYMLQEVFEDMAANFKADKNRIDNLNSKVPNNDEEAAIYGFDNVSEFINDRKKDALRLRGDVKSEIVKNFRYYVDRYCPDYTEEKEQQIPEIKLQIYTLAFIDPLIAKDVQLLTNSANIYKEISKQLNNSYKKATDEKLKEDIVFASALAFIFYKANKDEEIPLPISFLEASQGNFEEDKKIWQDIRSFVSVTYDLSNGMLNKIREQQYSRVLDDIKNSNDDFYKKLDLKIKEFKDIELKGTKNLSFKEIKLAAELKKRIVDNSSHKLPIENILIRSLDELKKENHDLNLVEKISIVNDKNRGISGNKWAENITNGEGEQLVKKLKQLFIKKIDNSPELLKEVKEIIKGNFLSIKR